MVPDTLPPFILVNCAAVPCKLFLLLEGSTAGSAGIAASACGPGQQPTPLGRAVGAAPTGFAIKRHFRLSMRKGVHVKLLLGQRPEEAEAEAAAAAAAAGAAAQDQQDQQGILQAAAGAARPADEGGPVDMECGGSSEVGASTLHMSQLPDAEPPSQTAAGARALVADKADAATQGPLPVWYLCKSVVRGLHRGGQADGAG